MKEATPMDAPTKKCPMCAEQIPLEATVCEYCGAKFEVSIIEGRVESKFIEEALPESIVVETVQPTPPPGRKEKSWLLILAIVLIVGVVGGLLWFAGGSLMVALAPKATATQIPTRAPSRVPNYAATQQARNIQATAAAQDAWVRGFAQPILDDVHGRRPNFEDDFSVMSGRFVRWGEEQGVTFTGDVMRINTGGREWVGAGGSLIATDFVLEFDFTPRIISNDCGVSANFRAGDPGGYNFGFNLHDFWWGMGSLPAGEDYRAVAEGWSEMVSLNRRTSVAIIAKGDRFAFYANGKPLLYVVNTQFNGDWVDIGVWSPNDPAEVDFDNVKFWDLDNLK